ncbi:hypothetical protein [Streptomyces sp. NBC_01233]|uniref:hypothetical protein n=1 Tax=Streptomyces sp. NBC_01233 TaxID=2903787 RepID=UPI002E13DF0F|nr:hypothetical protein OG332_10605 [Streptomyces sp. NBC_01233]
MSEQPVRHTVDTITDNDLDQLYGQLGLARHLLANVQQTSTEALNRAEKAERVAESAARDAAKALTDYLAAEQRAEQAEAAKAALKRAHVALAEQSGRDQAAIARAREVEEKWRLHFLATGEAAGGHALAMVRAALDEPKEPRP